MKRYDTKSIIVAINLANASWRDFLSGFLEATREHPRWSLRIVDPADVGKIIEKINVSGIVIGDILEPVASILARKEIPSVVVGSQSTSISSRRKNIAFLHNDDEDIGREGARVLDALGMRSSYGFVPHTDATHWSNLRAHGFSSEMKSNGKKAVLYRKPHSTDSKENSLRLQRWLLALPKPAAIMAACDAIAVDVVDICKTAHIRVPEQIAILGVDNDRLLCESSSPSLSSLAPDHFHEGELAAQALVTLLKRPTTHPRTILCTRKKLVLRESTQATKPAVILMQRALEFISENAASKITSSDVARHLGVSRQLIELRFREFGERTLAATIRNTRLMEVRRQLKSSKLSIHAIATNCGWSNASHLENAFKRRFGVSMRSWRNA